MHLLEYDLILIFLPKLENKPFPSGWLLDAAALQQYILACCQHRRGGLLDKPGKSRDFYHTCYTLSGLSVAQHSPAEESPLVLGPSEENENEVEKVHPLFNVTLGALEGARQFFFDHREEAAEVQEEEGEEEEEGDQTTSEPMEEKEV